MNDFTIKAKSILEDTGCTLVFLKDSEIYTDRDRGVKTLLGFVNMRKTFSGFSVADKVVGKAAAYLYVILDIKELYANILSKEALDVLQSSGIKVFYGILVDRIRNRSNTGFCPMEEAVFDVRTPTEAVVAINEKFSKLNG